MHKYLIISCVYFNKRVGKTAGIHLSNILNIGWLEGVTTAKDKNTQLNSIIAF